MLRAMASLAVHERQDVYMLWERYIRFSLIYYAIMTLWMKALEADRQLRSKILFSFLINSPRRCRLFWFSVIFSFPWFSAIRPHRNALNTFHKIRRHLNEPPRTASKPTNSIKLVLNRPTYSSSQLSIKVSDLHAGLNGRLEISCMGTIPAKVGKGEMYADFKSYSVKSKCRHLYSFVLKHDLESLEKHKTTIFRLRDFKDGARPPPGRISTRNFHCLERKEWKDLFLIRTTFIKPAMK